MRRLTSSADLLEMRASATPIVSMK